MPDHKFPNLFLIGSMKSGTTSLHDALALNRQIFMSEYKEPQYFTGVQYTDRVVFDNLPLPDPEGRWYFDLFEKARHNPEIKYAGESSTDYTQRPIFEGCAERILAFNPEARILFIMRDPVERCIAHYWHNVGIELETRSPREAVRQDPRFLAFSDYAYQLEPYLKIFPRKHIHVLSFESFRDDQQSALRAIFRWLDVDVDFEIPKSIRSNSGPQIIYQVRPGMERIGRLMQSRLWRKTGGRIPLIQRIAFRQFFQPIRRDAYDMSEFAESIRPILAEKARAVSRLVGQEFPEWKTTFPEGQPRSAVPPSDNLAEDRGHPSSETGVAAYSS